MGWDGMVEVVRVRMTVRNRVKDGIRWNEMQWDSGLRLVRYRFRFKLRSTFS
jgi:hypothetical protein